MTKSFIRPDVGLATKKPLMSAVVTYSLAALAAVVPLAKAHSEVTEKQVEEIVAKFLNTPKGQQSVGKAVEAYVKDSQAKAGEAQKKAADAEVEKAFKEPLKIDIGSSPVKGPAAAVITLVEFSDFECPYCKRGASTADEVLKAYPTQVKLAFKNLPLPFHNNALPAAKAALAAGRQNKFWEFHDALFENQRTLGEPLYVETATKLKLNMEQFNKDRASAEIEKQIKDDSELAKSLDIQGTPGFVVGGVPVKGAYPVEHFKKIVDRLLADKK